MLVPTALSRAVSRDSKSNVWRAAIFKPFSINSFEEGYQRIRGGILSGHQVKNTGEGLPMEDNV